MSDDDRRRRELNELQEKLLAVFADTGSGSVQLPDGSTLTVDRNSPDGPTVRIDVDGAVFRAFPPADAAPEDYPVDLPFMPGLAVILNRVSDDLVALQWFDVQDAANLTAEMERLLQRDGWERIEVQALPAPPVTIATFAKADMERTLISGGPMAMLLQKRNRA